MKEIGALGEQLVSQWLINQEYKLLQQGWHCRWGEIDLIAQDKVTQTLAFVEVKTRSQTNWDENGLLAVNLAKQQKIFTTASFFLAKYPHLAELPCRFDVALVTYQVCQGQLGNSGFNIAESEVIKIGQPVLFCDRYEFTLRDYLQSAFEGF
jgi:putative endonuclease